MNYNCNFINLNINFNTWKTTKSIHVVGAKGPFFAIYTPPLHREVKDRRNNDVLRVWYHAEAWLELIRLAALCGGRAVLFLCFQH